MTSDPSNPSLSGAAVNADAAAGEALALAQDLRTTLGTFVRSVRAEAGTPTTARSETLALLDRHGPLSIADLAGHRHVKHQSMRVVTGQLEDDGLLRKQPHPVDGRSVLLGLTDKGRLQLARSRDARSERIAELIATRLNDQERQTLRDAIVILQRLT